MGHFPRQVASKVMEGIVQLEKRHNCYFAFVPPCGKRSHPVRKVWKEVTVVAQGRCYSNS